MNFRRSTRLASKSSSLGHSDNGYTRNTGEGVIFEESEGRHVSLRSRTPKTPYQRVSQKRKRKNSLSTPLTQFPAEVGRNTGNDNENREVSPGLGETPKILTQSHYQNGEFRDTHAKYGTENGDSSFNADVGTKTDTTFGNDSFLMAVDSIERNGLEEVGTKPIHLIPEVRGVKHNGVQENFSPDVFGDDDELLEAFPMSPPTNETTPAVNSRSKRITPKRLLNPDTSKMERHTDFKLAGEVLEKSFLERAKELSMDENKRTLGGKKKKGGQNFGRKKKNNSKFKLAFTNRKNIKELANSASNELSKEDLSYMSNEERLQLSSWSLPPSILDNYRRKGITSLFPWQLACLANEKVLEGRNLLYSAPTSAGKTLVAEILMIKRVLELGRKAIMILPFVSVAREKVYSLQSIFGDAGVRVEGFMGSVNPPGGFKAVDIAICTIEKANSLINKLLEEKTLADLGTLVLDELHLISDPHRGYLLELLLTKIKYMTSIKNNDAENSMNMSEDPTWKPRPYQIQVIGMSATLPNLGVLAEWLNAELYVTDFRPVPLKELIKIDDKLFDEKLDPARDFKLDSLPVEIAEDMDGIIYLALETVLNGFSVLIFCPSRQSVEKTAERIAHQFYNIGGPGSQFPEIGAKLREQLSKDRIKAVLEQLEQCPGGVDGDLSKTVGFGVGYHHAGLTYENRDIVESAFKRGILRVIVATSTLSAGVNLPARRVMITTPMFNGHLLDIMTYHQMCGRAGRNGIDTEGESILICPHSLKEKGISLFRGSMPLVRSALLGDGSLTSSMKRALLEAIASGIAKLPSDVKSYARCTFLFHSLDSGLYNSEELSSSQLHKDATIEECINYLKSQDFIRMKQFEQEGKPDEYMPTQLGAACLASSLSPDQGIMVYKELLKARECFVLENELHVIYQVTPIYVTDSLKYIEWADYLDIWGNLDLSEKKVADLVGISESFIIKAMIGTVSDKNPAQRPDMQIHKRFFAALALSDLVNEKSLEYVSKRYKLNKGALQSLQQQASTFAGMVTAFCNKLGWSNLELLLSQFQERLEFGVQRELCDLVRLDCLNGQRARILYDAGLKTLMELAATDPSQVEQILHRAAPFKSTVHGQGGTVSSIWMLSKETLTEAEASQKIVQDARTFIQIELGQQGNIQFAFGRNDIPSLPTEERPGPFKPSTGNTEDSSSSSDNEDKESEEVPEESVTTPNEVVNSEAGNNDEKVQTEELFTQCQQDLENSASIPNFEVDKVNYSQDCFEDSFPDIVDTNLSTLYAKPQESPEQDQQNHRRHPIFSPIEEPLTPDIRRTREPDAGRSETPRSEQEILQSTPMARGRTEIPSSRCFAASEARHSPKNDLIPESLKESNTLDQRQDFHEISAGLMAALEGEFDSDEVLESSMKNDEDSREPECLRKVSPPWKNASVKLSESDAAAMMAIAEETNFESEELFPADAAANDVRGDNPVPKLTENFVDDFDEEDFILTQGPEVDANEDDELDVFGESSSETEDSSSIHTAEGSYNQNSGPLYEGIVGNEKLTVRVVQSADAIPASFFSESEMIGVGLKLVPQKKGSSIARQGIGARIIGKKALSNTKLEDDQQHSIAIYNGTGTIWVLQWNSNDILKVNSGNSDKGVNRLSQLLSKLQSYKCALVIFACKDKLRTLLKQCGAHLLSYFPPGERIWDPTIAQWMWSSDDEDKNFRKGKLINEYIEEDETAISSLGWEKEVVESYTVWKVMTRLKVLLVQANLWNHFTGTEMPSIIPLLLMELNGFGLDSMQLSKLKRVLQFKSALLELQAYQLAGRQFSIKSTKDIKQVLYREIGLKQPKASGTSKNVLLKLDHELPRIIVEYRKVESALQKSVIPFQQEKNLETGRVHGNFSHYTVTGRVVMSDPSLQTIPRDFDIPIFYNEKEVRELKYNLRIKFGTKLAALFQQIDNAMMDPSFLHDASIISMRNAFIPCSPDFTIVSADYSQLELRILAHLSKDVNLVAAMNAGTDVFIEIASQWKKLPKEQVTSAIRHEAKGIVYGIIYGMGAKSLSEQLEIDEREADKFIAQFMRAYPGVKSFLDRAKSSCAEKEYVETITGRRRYLPLINSRLSHEKAKAGRQATNTQIQGSAADLVKSAMARIHAYLSKYFPKSSIPIEWNKLAKARRSSLSIGAQKSQLDDLICFPILNLHDELIFEVRKTYLSEIVKVIKREMEGCVNLSVKFPVVVKTGDSWGTLETYRSAT